MCTHSYEQGLLGGALSDDQVHDAVRVAATVNAAAVALDCGGDPDRRPVLVWACWQFPFYRQPETRLTAAGAARHVLIAKFA